MGLIAAPTLPAFPPKHPSFDISTDQSDGSKTVRLLEASIKVPPYGFSERVVSVWDSLEVSPKAKLEVPNMKDLWDLLYCGALHIRSKCGIPVTAAILTNCCAWCDILDFLSKQLNSSAALDLLLGSWQVVVEIGPVPGIKFFDKLCNAFEAHRRKYAATRIDAAFRECRILANKLVEVGVNDLDRVKALAARGRLYGMRMDDNLAVLPRNTVVRRSIEDLSAATEILKKGGVKEQAHGDTFNCLAFALSRRFEIAHKKEDILTEIQCRTDALEYIGRASNLWSGWADGLARAFWRKYDEYSQTEDVNAAIAVFEQIIEADPSNPHASTGLAEVLRRRASSSVQSNSSKREDFERAIHLLENVIVNTPDNEKAIASRLGKCSSVLATRYSEDGVVDDLDTAIELQETARALSPYGGLWFHDKQLCEYYIRRCTRLESEEDLGKALAAGQRSVDETGPQMASRADSIFQLGCAQGTAYNRTKDREMLSKAIASLRTADQLETELLWRSVAVKENLAQSLGLRYDVDGNAQDGAEAIKLARDAVDILRKLSGRGNQAREARCLEILGVIYWTRYTKFFSQEDLNEAITACRRSCDMTDNEHLNYAIRVKNLANVLGTRYSQYGQIQDVRDAEELVESTLSILNARRVLPSVRDFALLINQKGSLQFRRYVKNGDRAFLDSAVKEFSYAAEIDTSCETWPHNQAQAAARLAIDLPTPAHFTNALSALKNYQRKIRIQRAYDEHDDLAISKVRAKIALAYVVGKDPKRKKAHENILGHLQKIALSEKAAPDDRLWAAGEAASYLYQQADRISEATRFINIAVQLLPQVTTVGLTKADQLRAYKEYNHLPKFALAFNIMAGSSVNESVKMFEQARSILWNRLLDQHVEVSSAESKVPELVEEFRKLQTTVNAPRRPLATADRIDGMVFSEPDPYKEANDYQILLKKIQAVPGLEDFPAAPFEDKNLTKYARYGPIVCETMAMQY